MKNTKLALILLLPMLALVGCSNAAPTTSESIETTDSQKPSVPSEPVVDKMGVDYIYTLLTTDAIRQEVESSNQVSFKEVINNSNRTETILEDIHILNNQQTYYYGSHDVKYVKTPSFDNVDHYIRKSEAKLFNNQMVYYDVTDYENKKEKNRATRLPILKEAGVGQEGVDYLLESSVDAQLCKQSSLFVAQFINTYLLNNKDLGGIIPVVYIKDNADNTTSYYLHDFSYNYEDEGITTTVNISFDVKLEKDTNRFLDARTVYHTEESQGEDDVYFSTDTIEYAVSYGERDASVDTRIEVEDYFINKVSEIRAYIADGDKKIYLDTNALPVDKYIRFEALTYEPSKAVDIMMYPVNTSKDFVTLGSETCFAEVEGSSTLTFQTATGIYFNKIVTFKKSAITVLNFTCVDELMEKTYDDNGELIYQVYNETEYNSLYLTAKYGEKLNQDDIEVVYEHPELMKLEIQTAAEKNITYKLNVLANPNNVTDTTITFKSKSNPSASVVVKFQLKKKLNATELSSFLLSHEYVYENIYTHLQYKVKFVSETKGIYTDNDGSATKEIEFDYTVNDAYHFDITFAEDTYYAYDKQSMRVSRDGKELVWFVGDGSLATHHYRAL